MSDFPQTPESNEPIESREVHVATETITSTEPVTPDADPTFHVPAQPVAISTARSPWIGQIATVLAAALVGGVAGHFSAGQPTSALTLSLIHI